MLWPSLLAVVATHYRKYCLHQSRNVARRSAVQCSPRMGPPSSFQEVTAGPLSYGTTSGAPPQRPLADKWRSEVCFHHNLYDTIEAHGRQVGIKHPVALLTGTCALVLLVIIATLRPAVPGLHSPSVDPDTGMFVSAEGELLFQQLPCWTGSCDHWQFEDPNGVNPWTSMNATSCPPASGAIRANENSPQAPAGSPTSKSQGAWSSAQQLHPKGRSSASTWRCRLSSTPSRWACCTCRAWAGAAATTYSRQPRARTLLLKQLACLTELPCVLRPRMAG